MNAELVGLGVIQSGRHAALPVVVGARAGGAADAVAPVVAVGEATAGPAVVRRADALHILDEAAADAVEVGDLRIPSDPDAVVDHRAKMLDEVPIDMGVDFGPRRLRGNFNVGVGGKCRAKSRDQAGGGTCRSAKEVSAVHMVCHVINCAGRRLKRANRRIHSPPRIEQPPEIPPIPAGRTNRMSDSPGPWAPVCRAA